MKCAKLISETTIGLNVPRRAEWQGRTITGDLSTIPGLLPSLGFYPLTETPAPPPREGYREEAHYAYDDAGNPTAIVQSWFEVEDTPAPRTFRRSYLAQWIRAHGKWDALQALLGQSADLAFFWEYSTEFDEYHAQWSAALAAVKAALGLSDADVADMLAAAEE